MKNNNIILMVFFVSGMASLIYEITWIRPISMIYQSTIYVIAIILTSFMFGLAIGGYIAGKYADKIKHPLRAYAFIEIGIGLYGLFSLSLFGLLPHVFDTLHSIHAPLVYNSIQFGSVFFLLLIPTALMGATFPIISKSYVREKIGKGIGEIYSINNIGAIIGSILAGFILIPLLGIRISIVVAALLNMTAAFLILGYYYKTSLKYVIPISAIFFITFASCGNYSMTNIYSNGVCGFFVKDFTGPREILFYEEGLYGSISVAQEGQYGEIKRLFINGQGSSSLRLNDVRVSTLLGYLPILIKPDSSNTLVIGFGTGATSNILSKHFNTTTVEIERKILKTAHYFNAINGNVINNPNHNFIFDDARNYLLTARKQYGIIVNHPLDPFQSFSSLLFTKEFFHIVRNSLNEDGLYVQWFPTYHLKPQDLKDFQYTFNSVFPYSATFVTLKQGETINFIIPFEETIIQYTYNIQQNGGELITIGSTKPLNLNKANLHKKFRSLTPADKSLLQLTSLYSSDQILNLLLFTEKDIGDYIQKADFITDDKPKLEFTTPLNNIKKRSQLENEAMNDLMSYLNKNSK